MHCGCVADIVISLPFIKTRRSRRQRCWCTNLQWQETPLCMGLKATTPQTPHISGEPRSHCVWRYFTLTNIVYILSCVWRSLRIRPTISPFVLSGMGHWINVRAKCVRRVRYEYEPAVDLTVNSPLVCEDMACKYFKVLQRTQPPPPPIQTKHASYRHVLRVKTMYTIQCKTAIHTDFAVQTTISDDIPRRSCNGPCFCNMCEYTHCVVPPPLSVPLHTSCSLPNSIPNRIENFETNNGTYMQDYLM